MSTKLSGWLGAAQIHGRIRSVMPIGSDQFLGLEVEQAQVFVRVGKEGRYRDGENVSIGVNTHRLHFFDPVSEASLLADDGAANGGLTLP
ncbi:MAG: hypothetical protein R3E68_08020 [Burkholderiaceae bacterium]